MVERTPDKGEVGGSIPPTPTKFFFMKIGIPRALIYWKFPFFWEKFFESLNFEVLLSPPTNKEIVEEGVKISDPETCFSNKVYFGHLKWLDGKCDLIFVPRLKTNEEKLEYCPKFFGLPDLAKIVVKTKILTEEFDERKRTFEESIINLGKKLKKDERTTKEALAKALFEEKILKEKEEKEFLKKMNSKKKKIVIVSHPYNWHDEYVNLRMEERLENLGVEPIFIEEIPPSNIQHPTSNIQFHWEFGKEIMEKIETTLKYKIDGAIQISSFACGCDAVLKEFVEKKFKQAKIPFLYLIIDEHTGEAGFQTRLEAFVDTL